MKIAKDSVVSIDYRLHLGDGNTIDAEPAGRSRSSTCTATGRSSPGWSRRWRAAGWATEEVAVAPAQGYGEHDPEGVQEVPRERFPDGMLPKEGAMLSATDARGRRGALRA